MKTPCDVLIDGRYYCPFEDYGGSDRCRVCCGLGVDEDSYPDEDECDPYCDPEFEDDYCPSSTNGDYSPNNPWDAPGMSVRDFI